MEDQVPTITCSAVEATFLASLLGADMLLGIPDPFHGWLTEEIEEAWDKARTALAERRFIVIEGEGGIVMDTAVAALAGTWAFPEASFIVTFTSGDSTPDVRYFHLTRYLAVEQIPTTEPAVQLIALEDATAVYQRVIRIFGLEHQIAAPGRSAVLPEATLTQARVQAGASGIEAAQSVLQRAGVGEATAISLAHTLADPVANGALVALVRRTTTWEVAGIGLLEGHNGLWRLRSSTRENETWVEAIPCPAAQAREEIRRVMNRMLPEPLPAG